MNHTPTLLLILTLLLMSSCKTKKDTIEARPFPSVVEEGRGIEYAPSTLIIMVDAEIGKEPLHKAIKNYGATIIYDYSIIPGMAIRIPDGKDIHEAMTFFKKVKGVVSVERDRITRLTDPVRPKLEVK
ncbi:MAG: hypothetical protein IJ197_07995 [Bacteroidaceae bacterium]|nr:hypothetical protein [Bacteroidaceae bacterium]